MEEVEMIKRKWKNLRDTFVKSLKKGSEKPWKHMEAMSFLLPFLQIKTIGGWKDSSLSLSGPSSSSLEENPSVPEVQVKSEDEDSSQYWRNISFLTRNVEVVLGASEGRDSTPSRKRAREEPFNPSGRYSEALSPAFAHNFGQMRISAEDHDEEFFLVGMAVAIRRLNPVLRLAVKRAITNAVFDAQTMELELQRQQASE